MKRIIRILSLVLILSLAVPAAFAAPPEERTLYDTNGIVAVLLPHPFIVLTEEELQEIASLDVAEQEELDPEVLDSYRTALSNGLLNAGCGVNGDQTVFLTSVENPGFTQRTLGLVRDSLDQTYFEVYASYGATDVSSDIIKRGGNSWYVLKYSLMGTDGTIAVTWVNGYQIVLSCANIDETAFRYMLDQIKVL